MVLAGSGVDARQLALRDSRVIASERGERLVHQQDVGIDRGARASATRMALAADSS